MAFNIHWKILFKSLRAGTVYTVNVWKDGSLPSGYPLTLKGAAEPMTTDEDADEDMFCPVRKQSGYFRIVDDGRARNANGQEVDFDWKEMLPVNDTDRPVTLTHVEGSTTVTDWQGFMQAQNFGSELYGNPQEREYPIQCALTILEGYDINYQQKEIQNFAYLLNQILGAIPAITIENVVVQNRYAKNRLLKRIDWQNFVDEDNDGNLSAKYNLYECLEDMCSFWGWTARTHGKTLYFNCTDGVDGNDGWSFTRAQLNTMASGTEAGTWVSDIPVVNVTGDIFASTDNHEFKVRGPNKAQVKADVNRANPDVISIKTQQFKNQVIANGWGNVISDEDGSARYTNDTLSIATPLMTGTATSGVASFNMAHLWKGENANPVEVPIIRMKQKYNGSVYASFQSVYEHGMSDCSLIFKSRCYYKYIPLSDGRGYLGGLCMRIGIGKTRASAIWLGSGGTWTSTPTVVTKPIHHEGEKWFDIAIPTGVTGLIFIDFLGAERDFPIDLDDIDSDTTETFDIADFSVCIEKLVYTHETDGFADSENNADYQEYESTNGNNVRMEWNADCIYASDHNLPTGYGMLMNIDNTFMQGIHNVLHRAELQEEWLAECVTLYWAQAKRKIETEVRSNINCSLDIGGSIAIGNITPMHRALMDSTTFSPISISHSWRDDVTKIVLLEIPA